MNIKDIYKRSIPTEYKGVLFRSSLEARWAKRFDDAGLKYEYEPLKRMAKDGSVYTFDFEIKDCGYNFFIEVKPSWDCWLKCKEQKYRMWQVIKEMGNHNNLFILLAGYPDYSPIGKLVMYNKGGFGVYLELLKKITVSDTEWISALEKLRKHYALMETGIENKRLHKSIVEYVDPNKSEIKRVSKLSALANIKKRFVSGLTDSNLTVIKLR